MLEPTLYGIINSNRSKKDFWGKNQFNSSFPVSLACYMRDKGFTANYISLNDQLEVQVTEISFDKVFNSNLSNDELFFSFESKYEPYQVYSYDDIHGIDLVIKNLKGEYLTPLEIKLTVLPDNTTANLNESDWGSEIVIRPATTKYAALGIVDSVRDELNIVKDFFEESCHNIEHWTNSIEMCEKFTGILQSLNAFQKHYINKQKPILMQPIWKTQGQSPLLSDNAFDIFIWSDYALTRLFLDSPIKPGNISRLNRSALRLTRILYEISSSKKTRVRQIYTDMAFKYQTDKEFSVSGSITKNYMKSKRKENPIIHKSSLKNIILNGGEKFLRPERRFDQTIYFTIDK